MMELAQRNKKKQNLEIPATSSKLKGIISQNPFHVLHKDSLLVMADQVGIDVVDDIGSDFEDLPPDIPLVKVCSPTKVAPAIIFSSQAVPHTNEYQSPPP